MTNQNLAKVLRGTAALLEMDGAPQCSPAGNQTVPSQRDLFVMIVWKKGITKALKVLKHIVGSLGNLVCPG